MDRQLVQLPWFYLVLHRKHFAAHYDASANVPVPPRATAATAAADDDDDEEDDDEPIYSSDYDEEGKFIYAPDDIYTPDDTSAHYYDPIDEHPFGFLRVAPSLRKKWCDRLRAAREQNISISDEVDDETKMVL